MTNTGMHRMQQAKNLGERLKNLKIVKVLTSDLLRTKQTAQAVLQARSEPLQMVENDLLREREFGDLKGTSYADFPMELFHPKSDYQPPNGESWETFHARIGRAWDWVLSHAKSALKGPEDVLLVVTHGLVKSSLASRIWNFKEHISFENTSVSTVSLAAPHQIHEINCTSHLEDLLAAESEDPKAKL